jgi:homoserine kinase type II
LARVSSPGPSGFCYARRIAVYTIIEPSLIAEFLRGYGCGELTQVQEIAAGSVNTNFLVVTSQARFFLRIYEQLDAQEAVAETRLLTYLLERDVPTPRVIASTSGVPMRELAGKPAVLFALAEGRDLCSRLVTSAHTHALGRALAQLHLAARDFPGLSEGRFSFSAICQRIASLHDSANPTIRGVLPDLEEEIAWLRANPSSLPQGVIHADLFRDNVRFEGTRIVALMDFESACRGTLSFDVATCLLSWTFADDFDASLGRALVSGYQEIRPLTAAERDGGLYAEARRAALRFTVTRILDFHLRTAAGARREKDFRRYLQRLHRLRALGPRGAAQLWALL